MTPMNDWQAQEDFNAWVASGEAPGILTAKVEPGMVLMVNAFRDVCLAGFCAGRDSVKPPVCAVSSECGENG